MYNEHHTFDTPTVTHPLLSTTFHGLKHPISTATLQLEQFRGIKYAKIEKRFRRSRLLKQGEYPEHVDATKYGPIAPQATTTDLETTLYNLPPHYHPPIGQHHPHHQDEFECLNLNITAPAYLTPDSKLPVMVWVHGGGNVGGHGNRWVIDGGHLVKRSMELSRHGEQNGIIFIAINYRLGLFGFAASPEIKSDNGTGVGNYGLHDQLNALRWIHTNISYFGGDPSRITVCGQGKGAIDVHALLLAGLGHYENGLGSQTGKGLVNRAILQSGTCPNPSSFPTPGQQGVELMRIYKALGISFGDGMLDKLREVSAEELVKVCERVKPRISPTNDGVFFRSSTEFMNPIPPSPSLNAHSSLPTSPRTANSSLEGMDPPPSLGLGISAILLGDTYTESTPYTSVASSWTPNALSKRLRAVLRDPWKTDAVLRAYDLNEFGGGGGEDEEGGWDEDRAWGYGVHGASYGDRVGQLMADCLVGYGIERLANRLAIAKAVEMRKFYKRAKRLGLNCSPSSSTESDPTGTKVYRYLFDQPSPFNSTAHHTVDLVYLFGNVDFEKAASDVLSGGSTPSSSSGADSLSGGVNGNLNGLEMSPVKKGGVVTLSPVQPGSLSPSSPAELTSASVTSPIPPNNKNNILDLDLINTSLPRSRHGPLIPSCAIESEESSGLSHLSIWNSSNWAEERHICETMQEKWIEFVKGGEPWGEYWPVLPKGWGEEEEVEQNEESKEQGVKNDRAEGPSILATPDPSPQLASKHLTENSHSQTQVGGTPWNPQKSLDPRTLRALEKIEQSIEESGIRDDDGLLRPPTASGHGHSHSKRDSLPSSSSHNFSHSQNHNVHHSPNHSPKSITLSTSAASHRSQNTHQKRLESTQGKIYIFGPTGETYPVPVSHLAHHRRVDQWREGFEDCPVTLGLRGAESPGMTPGKEKDEEDIFNGMEFGMESSGFRMGESALEEKEIVRIGMELVNGPPEWRR